MIRDHTVMEDVEGAEFIVDVHRWHVMYLSRLRPSRCCATLGGVPAVARASIAMRARPIPAHVPSSMERTGQCSCRNTRRARRASEWRRRRPQPIPPCTPPFAVTQHLTTPTTFRVPLHSPPPRDFKHPPFAVTQHLTTPTTFRDPRLPSFAVTQLLTIPRTFPSPPANLARLTEPYGFARWYARLAVTRDGSLDAPLPTPSPSPSPLPSPLA